MAGWLREAMMASNDTMSDCLKFLQDVIDTYSSGDAEYRSSLCRRGDAILLRLFATGTSQGTFDCLLPVIVSLRRRQKKKMVKDTTCELPVQEGDAPSSP